MATYREKQYWDRLRREAIQQFWSNPAAWPSDAPDHVFLARSIERIAASSNVDLTEAKLIARKHCQHNRLVAAIMQETGAFVRMPQTIWNTDKFLEWFEVCKAPINEAEGQYGQYPWGGPPMCWLYIERDGLDTLLAPAVDRSPKSKPAGSEFDEWRRALFAEVKRGDRPRPGQADVERLAREAFPNISIPYVREEVWDKRPWRRSRAPRGG